MIFPLLKMDSTEASSSAGTSKKVRGRTRCIDLFKLPQRQKFKVCLNDMGQPTGENAAKLQNNCSILARDGQLLPLDCPSWRDIDENTKKHVLAAVQMKFDIEESGHQFILQSVSKKWRDFKCGIKRKYYDPEMAIPALYARHPEGVLHNQWRNLVQFWTSQESQKISDRNKINRSHQEMSHTSGTKSFANVRHEEQLNSASQALPSRADVFIKTHIRKDGSAVDVLSQEKIQQMKELKAQIPEGSQDSTGRYDIFSQVMGPERRGRGCGLGPNPTKLWGSSSSYSDASSSQSEICKLKDQVKSLQAGLMEKDAEMQELRNIVQSLSRQVGEYFSRQEAPTKPGRRSNEEGSNNDR